MVQNEDDWLIQEFTRQVLEEAAKGKGTELLRVLQEGLTKTAQAETGRLVNCIDAVRQQINSSVETIPAKTTEKLTTLFQGTASAADVNEIRQTLTRLNRQLEPLPRILDEQQKRAEFGAGQFDEIHSELNSLIAMIDNLSRSFQKQKDNAAPLAESVKLEGVDTALDELRQNVGFLTQSAQWQQDSIKAIADGLIKRGFDLQLPVSVKESPVLPDETRPVWALLRSQKPLRDLPLWQKVAIPVIAVIVLLVLTSHFWPQGLKRGGDESQPKPTTPAQNPKPSPPRELQRLLEQRVDSVQACSEQQGDVMRNCLRKLDVSLEKETIAELVDKVAASNKKAKASVVILQTVAKTLGKDKEFQIDGLWGNDSRKALDKIPCVAVKYNYKPIPQASLPETLLKEILPACAADLTKSAP